MFNLADIKFHDPAYLWLLTVIPFLSLILCYLWFSRRRAILQIYKYRTVPIREKYPVLRPFIFWAGVACAIALSVVALARPQVYVSDIQEGMIDVVFIIDGSSSMRVEDSKPTRWRRAIKFMRTFTETLSWKGDRIGIAAFAGYASPQVRLTNDPNVVMFFVDNLDNEPPFYLKDDRTWDTNIVEGIYWALGLLIKDEEFRGRSKNAQALIVISDGQAWSGELKTIVGMVKKAIPIYVVGVGTTAGKVIPESKEHLGQEEHSAIDRSSLRNIANFGGGEYFELDWDKNDSKIAVELIDRIKKNKINSASREKVFKDVHWEFLCAVAVILILGILPFYDRRGVLVLSVGTIAITIVFYSIIL